MRKWKVVSISVLLTLLMNVIPGVALADDPSPDKVLPGTVLADEPVIGPATGYSIDEPGPNAVVHKEAVQPLDDNTLQSLSPGNSIAAIYRSGWTDGWHDWIYPLTIRHVGSHNSDSDLNEDQIKVDGFMRMTSSWSDSCKRHTSGTSAHCRTEVTANLFYSFYVESHHSFHKSGYPDTYFETGKNVG